jgi:hypothetical protein
VWPEVNESSQGRKSLETSFDLVGLDLQFHKRIVTSVWGAGLAAAQRAASAECRCGATVTTSVAVLATMAMVCAVAT